MNVLKKVALVIAVVFAVTAYTDSFIRLVKGHRELGQLRAQVNMATGTVESLTRENAELRDRITASRREAEEIRRISEVFDKSIEDNLSDVRRLREGIREAEAYCSAMEDMLNSWIDKYGYDNSNLEVK